MLPPGSLDGRVAVVTGGGTGLGRAMAETFAVLGAAVVVAGRRPEPLEETAAAIRAGGGRAWAVPTDVREPQQVDALFERCEAEAGPCDLLVNNAAGNFLVRAEELSPGGWRAVLAIVLDGSFYCCRRFARPLLAADRAGSVVNIIVSYAWTGAPWVVHSAAAKGGVLALTRSLAQEWGGRGIRVNAIAPGPVETEGAAAALWPTPEAEAALKASVPVGRLGLPKEVAWAAAYLSSPYAGFINGEVLTLDGGQWLGPGMFKLPEGRS